METITQTKKLILHPALGWLLKVVLSNGSRYNIFCEWFYHLKPEWSGEPDALVGLEVTEEWCKDMNENLS
jgi:hypothetical protein